MSTKFNPAIMQEYANRLYAKAATLVLQYTCLGIVTGAGMGFGIYWFNDTLLWPSIGAGSLMFGILGYTKGKDSVFVIHLLAQQSLWQVQMELNTRKP